MRVATILVFVAVVLSVTALGARPKWHQLEGYTFEQYQKDFNKVYKGDNEFEERQFVFDYNLRLIQAHNRDATTSHKKGVNQFTDRTKDELARINGGKAVAMRRKVQELSSQASVQTHKNSGLPLPNSVDWRTVTPSVLSAVKDQGVCGNGFALAATESVETYHAMATGELFALSTQEATACTANPSECGGTGACNGGIADGVFDYVKDHGIAQEWSNPYRSYEGVSPNCTNDTSPMVWLDGHVKLTANSQEDVMDALAHTGPLAVNVDASNWFHYESGIFDGCHYSSNITIDHVAQLVGYGSDPALGMDYWTIRNSWNPTFGEQGYIRIKRTANKTCGYDVHPQEGTACKGSTDNLYVCGECGVLWDTSYPIVKRN